MLEPVFRNQQAVGVLKPEHFEAHELFTNDDRVGSVWEEVLDALQPRKRTTIHPDKADVVTQEFDRAARFLATKLPRPRLLLVDDIELRATANASLANLRQGFRRQQTSAPRNCGCPTLLHSHPLCSPVGLFRNRLTQGFADHFTRAPGPAFVKARIGHGDREVIPGSVATLLRARRALRPIVAAPFESNFDVLEDLKSGLTGLGRRDLQCRPAAHGFGNRQTAREGFKFGRGEPLHRSQVDELVGEVARRILKPIPMHIGAVNAERPADGVTVFRRADLILPWKDLDTVDLLEGSLDRDFETKGETIYIDAAEPCRQRVFT